MNQYKVSKVPDYDSQSLVDTFDLWDGIPEDLVRHTGDKDGSEIAITEDAVYKKCLKKPL